MRAKEVGVSGRGILHTSVAVVDYVVDVDVMLLEEVECLVEHAYTAFHLQGGGQAMSESGTLR